MAGAGGRRRSADYNRPVTTEATPRGNVRVPALSLFFPAHNEAENIEPLVREAIGALFAIADQYQIICVDHRNTYGT